MTARSLFSPLTVRGTALGNRIGLSPMCMYSAGPDGLAGDWHLAHLASRAAGGSGIVFTEAVSVTPEGRITDGDVGIWSDEHAQALGRIARLVRALGSVPGIQLSHAGRKGGRTIPWKGYEPIPEHEWGPLHAPTDVPFREDWAAPRPMTAADVKELVAAFSVAAARAVDAGFEAVELHFAHGYLVHQFLSPLVNTRTDEYGGDLRGRARVAREITAAVRAAIGQEAALFVRLSVVDWVDGGLTLEDSVEISRLLRDAGADVIDCSSGAVVSGERVPAAPLYQVPFAARIRREVGILTAAVGLITRATDAEGIVEAGHADVVLIGRSMLRDAYWPRVAARELEADASPAIPVPYRRAVQRMDAQTQW